MNPNRPPHWARQALANIKSAELSERELGLVAAAINDEQMMLGRTLLATLQYDPPYQGSDATKAWGSKGYIRQRIRGSIWLAEQVYGMQIEMVNRGRRPILVAQPQPIHKKRPGQGILR